MENFDYDKINNYFSGQLNSEEKAAFEQEIATNNALSKEFNFYQELMQGVDCLGDTELASTIQQAHLQASEKGLLLTNQDIFDYLNDEISEKKTELLEKRMAEDEAFFSDVELHQNLMSGITISGDEDLMQQIKQTHKKMKSGSFLEENKLAKVVSMKADTNQTRKRFFSSRNLVLAASFLLLLSLGLYFLLPSNSSNQLYANYFEINKTKLEDDLETLSLIGFGASDKERKENLLAALELFQNASYQQALDDLDKHLSKYADDETAIFYRGLTLMKLENFQDAIASFEQLTRSGSEKYQTAAIWYQALGYLKLKNGQEEALNLFQTISNDSTYGTEAKAIIMQLSEK